MPNVTPIIVAFGIWFLYNGQPERAYDLMEQFMETSLWGSFGYIAAEVDLVNRRGN